MLDAHVDNGFDVVVIEGIEDRFTDLAVFNDTRIFEDAELVGDSGHTHTELFGDVADTALAVKEEVEYFDSGTVADDGEELGEVKKMLVVGEGDVDGGVLIGGVSRLVLTHGQFFLILMHFSVLSFDG
jgi:hypothetical protein